MARGQALAYFLRMAERRRTLELGSLAQRLSHLDWDALERSLGERGYARAAKAKAEGIALEAATAGKLVNLARGFKLSIPEMLR